MSYRNRLSPRLQLVLKSSRETWIDNGTKYDTFTAVVFGIIIAIIIFVCPPEAKELEPRLSSLYQLISSSCANILGFIAATLTIVSGFGKDLAGAFNRRQFDRLFGEFYKAFAATMFCFVSPMLAILWPNHLLAILIGAALGFFLSSTLRVVILVFEINSKIVDKHLHDELQREQIATDDD